MSKGHDQVTNSFIEVLAMMDHVKFMIMSRHVMFLNSLSVCEMVQ